MFEKVKFKKEIIGIKLINHEQNYCCYEKVLSIISLAQLKHHKNFFKFPLLHVASVT